MLNTKYREYKVYLRFLYRFYELELEVNQLTIRANTVHCICYMYKGSDQGRYFRMYRALHIFGISTRHAIVGRIFELQTNCFLSDFEKYKNMQYLVQA